jgi:hypothetical protein
MISSSNLLNTVSAMGYDLSCVVFAFLCYLAFVHFVLVAIELFKYIGKGVLYICHVLRRKFFSKRS